MTGWPYENPVRAILIADLHSALATKRQLLDQDLPNLLIAEFTRTFERRSANFLRSRARCRAQQSTGRQQRSKQGSNDMHRHAPTLLRLVILAIHYGEL